MRSLGLARALHAFAALVFSLSAFADGSGPLPRFPITGAFSALHDEDRDHVSIIEFAGNYDRNLASGTPNVEPRAVIAREFFRTHPDEYDFIVAFSTFEFATGDALAFHWSVQNNVQGIGMPAFSNADLFGSPSGKLLGFIDMAALTRYKLDPADPEFESALSTLSHEVLHQWAARVKFRDANGSASEALLGKDGAHWSYLLDSDASVEYGAKWRDNGNGTFTSVGTRKFFSPLDLYLMGFYKAEEVPPFFLIENPSIDKLQLPRENVTITGTRRTVSIADVIAQEGPRIPSAENSQKEFRIAFVLIKAPNQQVTDAQLLAMNSLRTAFQTRFSIMTGGRAIAQVYPSAKPTEQTGTPGTISGGEVRATANLADGLTWLRGRQELDGRWFDKDTTAVRDTTAALGALAKLDAGFVRAPDAIQWLAQNPAANTDSLARRSRLLADLNSDAAPVNAQLVSLQNGDGGWGIASGYASNPLDTALALLALSGSSATTAIDRAAQYLATTQNPDGGWSASPGSPSRTTPTATVLRALRAASRHAPVAPAALAWLATKQNTDGGFGDSPSTVHDTANALQAFMALDALAGIQAASATNYILARQTVSGSWDGSVYATASAVSVLRGFNAANLAVSALSAVPNAPNDGERVQLSLLVRNEGNVNSAASVVRIYDGNPDSGGAQIGPDVAVPLLAPNASVTLTPTWDTLNHAGTHQIFAVVDPANAQTESTKLDNRASVNVVVAAAPTGIDLSFGTPDVTAMPLQPNRLPSTVGVSIMVRNLGLTNASGVIVKLWAGAPGSVEIGSQTINVLARSSQAVNFTHLVTTPGQFTLTAQIDPGNAIVEVNETNNVRAIQIATAASLDLAVTADDITMTPASALVGDDVKFSVRIRNEGTTDSTSTQARYSITDGNTTQVIATNSLQLNAGTSTTQTIPWRVNLTGSLTFTVQLDPLGLLPELDENNNIATRSLTGGEVTGANLTVAFQDFTWAPVAAREGYPLVLSAVVRNTGTLPANNVLVHFYNGDPALGGALIGTSTPGTIASGGSVTATYTWPAVPDSADKLLYVVVDPDNTVTEFAENDNRAFNVVTILSLPDLAIAAGDLALTPAFPRAGESTVLTVQVANLGAQSASNVQVRAYDGDPASGGSPIGPAQVIPAIAGFGHGSATFSWTATGNLGGRALFVVVDPDNAILERIKTNNAARRDITVQNADLYVTERYFSPDGDGIKDSTSLSFRLPAAQTVTVDVVNRRGKVVKHFAGPTLANVASATVAWDGLDELRRVVTDGSYRLRIQSTAGTTLGEVQVEVDNNHSSLMAAVDTPYATMRNLSCELADVSPLKFTADDTYAYFYVDANSSSVYDKGIYRMAADGSDIRPIVSSAQLDLPWAPGAPSGSGGVVQMEVAPDGSQIAFRRQELSGGQSYWVVNGDGTHLRTSQAGTNMSPWVPGMYSADTKTLFRFEPAGGTFNSIVAGSVTGTEPDRTVYSSPEYFTNWDTNWSPDGRKLILYTRPIGSSGWRVELVNTDTGTAVPFSAADFSQSSPTITWSPNGQYIAVVDYTYYGNDTPSIRVYNMAGELVRDVAIPFANDPVLAPISVISDVAWASNGLEFAFQVRSGPREPVDSPLGMDPGGIYIANVATGAVDLAAAYSPFDGTVYQSEGTEYPYSAEDGIKPYASVYWVPGERSLLVKNHYSQRDGTHYFQEMFAVLMDEDNEVRRVFGDEHLQWENLRFSATGRQMLFEWNRDAADPNSICYNQGSTDTFSFRSLLNLTADLRATRSARAGGLQLRGTAVDQNFSNYKLEFAPSTSPNTWQPIAPASGDAVVDDLLTTWVPPSVGNYFARLTVEDLAGNIRRNVRRVSWSDKASITDVYRTPAIASPNGDGRNDDVVVHYRVLEPVHLTFEIFNDANQRVRVFERDHSVIGTEFNLNWDGRDTNGAVVADGRYRLVVQNLEFFVTIDSTPPVALIDAHDAYRPIYMKGLPPAAAYLPGFEFEFADVNLLDSKIELGTGADPIDWAEIAGLECLSQYPPLPGDIAVVPRSTRDHPERTCRRVELREYANKKFRLTVRDKAGNETITTSSLGAEQLMLVEFANHRQTKTNCSLGAGANGNCTAEYADLDGVPFAPLEQTDGLPLSGAGGTLKPIERRLVRMHVADTLRTPVTQMFVQFRKVDVTEWSESPLTTFYGPIQGPVPQKSGVEFLEPAAMSNYFNEPVWDMAGVEPGEVYVARVRAVDGTGASHFSNALRFLTDGLDFRGRVRDPGIDEDLAAAFPKVLPLHFEEAAFWGKEFIAQPITLLQMFLKSEGQGTEFDPRYAFERQVDVVQQPDRVYVFKVRDLRNCKKYTPIIRGFVDEGTNPVTGEPILRAIELVGSPFSFDCLEIKATATPVQSEVCDAPAPEKIRFSLDPKAFNGGGLSLLTLSKPLPNNGGDDILYNVNRPANGGNYTFEIDVSNTPEGVYPYTARIVDDGDNVEEVVLYVRVDKTPAVVNWSYPQEGQRLCGVQRTMSDGQVRNSVVLEGLLTDAGGLQYRITRRLPGDRHVLVHDSQKFDSFRVEKEQLLNPPNSPYEKNTVAGPLAEIYNLAGDVTADLEVDDYSGFRQCKTRSFYFDGEVEGASFSTSAILFSPNLDERLDDITLRYSVDEAATVRVDVFAAVLGDKGWTPVGESLRVVQTPIDVLAGDSSVEWDGRNGAGTVVADGNYVVQAEFRDACGNVTRRSVVVEVDDTPPAVTLDYPNVGAAVPLIVEVQGSLSDKNALNYSAEFGVGSVPEAWVPVGGGLFGTPEVRVLGRWNTFGLEGLHAVRIVARDRAGNERIVSRQVNLQVRTNIISSFEPVPELFSPNADSRRDLTALRFELDNAATITLDVRAIGGATVRRLVNAQPYARGPATVNWNGLDDVGQPAIDGTYEVLLHAVLASNSFVTQDETIHVVMDRAPPIITIARPTGGFVQGVGAILGTISDPRLTEFEVSLADNPAAPSWEVIDSGTTPRINTVLGSLQGLAEGEHALKIVATDEAENQTTLVVPFVVDNTPPVVSLSAPENRYVASTRKGPVGIAGSIDEKNLLSYQLRVGAGAAPSSWTELAAGTTLPLPAVLRSWDVTAVADGLYTLELVAVDRAGFTSTARQQLIVDNTPPTVAITQPAALAYVKQPADLLGTANDANLASYVLEMAPGSLADASQFIEVGNGVAPVSAGTLGRWEAMPPDGVHTLRLTATDQGQNTAEVRVQVTVDTVAPEAPINLAGAIEGNTGVRLNWTANTEPDIAGYFVYRDNVRITPAPVSATTYLDANLAEARYTYEVVAIDRAAWESARSNAVTLAVDLTPPIAHLAAPVTGGKVSGLFDIVGTAQAAEDFREYRLFVGVGAAPSEFQLMRRSPLQVAGELMTEWNTVVLPEGATYSLKLEAEDINGNIATHQVTVTVDNLPPAAPTGLAGTATGANVALTWNANAEPDLLGYLLFRDDRLANQTGVLVGSLSPFALVNRNYADAALPDGVHDYYLLAIDQAGNISGPSTAIQVAIDTRTPRATIVSPADQARFDASLFVQATTPDTDIAQVQFQYRAQGSGPWSNLGAADVAAPYETSLDPVALSLARGTYQLRAVATDQTSHTDADPPSIAVIYQDITRPRATEGLAAHVDGGNVALSWTANTDTDLAGYLIERGRTVDSMQRITPAMISQLTFTDTGVADGSYLYRIVAVDQSGNEAEPGASVDALVYTPVSKQPFTPTAGTTMSFTGRGKVPATLAATLTNANGTTLLPPQTLGPQFQFAFANLPLVDGTNTVTVRLTDAAGNISKQGLVEVARGSAPSAPTNLQAQVNGLLVSLTWNPNPEANISGYRAYVRDPYDETYHTVDSPTSMPVASASASSETTDHPATDATDFRSNTYWETDTSEMSAVDQWISIQSADASLVTALTIEWDNGYWARDFDVEALFGQVWVPLAEVRDNLTGYSVVDLPQPYLTSQLRIVIRKTFQESDPSYPVRIRRIDAQHYELLTTPASTYSSFDGVHHYAVTAVNALGLESERSTPVEAGVGDVEPPAPVTLSGSVAGNDVSLDWTETAAADASFYRLYRDNVEVGTVDLSAPRTFVDAGVTNGTHAYTVTVLDQVGNESARSNVYTALIDVGSPPAPTALTVTTPLVSNALDLAWSPAAGSPGEFTVFRGAAQSGPYIEVGQTDEPQFRDSGLANGQTYWYRVHARDAFGNLSAPSNVASGIPQDLAPPVVNIHFPTVPGQLLVTTRESTTLVARTEPGATVTLTRGGANLRTAQAITTTSTLTVGDLDSESEVRLSPDGRLIAYEFLLTHGEELRVRDVVSGLDTVVTTTQITDVLPTWSSDGRELYYLDVDDSFNYDIRAVRLSDGAKRVVAHAANTRIEWYSFSADDSRLVVYDSRSNSVKEVDLATGVFRTIENDVNFARVRLSPDGARYAYLDGMSLRVVHLASGQATVVDDSAVDFGAGTPFAWSPDGGKLAFLSSRVGGVAQAYTYSLATSSVGAVSSLANGALAVLWSPDSRAIAVTYYDAADNTATDVFDVLDRTVTHLPAYSSFNLSEWTRGGYLFGWAGEGYSRIAPPGRVEFSGVPLSAGDNVFAMSASDVVGNVGLPSSPVVISRVAEARPDLIIDDASVRIVPVAPLVGESARISVTVRNGGTAAAAASTVTVLAIGADGSSTALRTGVTVGSLAVEQRRTLTIDWTPANGAGAYSIVAVADPTEQITEFSEANNLGVADFSVIAEAGQQLSASTDRDAYNAGETVAGTVVLRNFSTPVTGRLTMAIEDSQGFVVRQLPEVAISALPYAGTRTENISWPTGATFAGAYQLHARFLNAAGTQQTESRAMFLITAASSFSATVNADRDSYASGNTAHVEGAFTYLSGNAPVSGAVATLQILDAANAVVAESTQNLGDLLPETSGQIAVDWAAGAVGSYHAVLRVTKGAELLTGAQTTFTVAAGAAQLAGTLSLSEQAPGAGTPQLASWRVKNVTGAGVSQLPIVVALISPDSPTPIVSERVLRDLSSGSEASGIVSFDTGLLRLQQYTVLLQVETTEGSQTRTQTLQTAAFNVTDRAPPTVAVRAPAINGFVGDAASASIFARDAQSSVAEVSFSIAQDSWFGASTTVAEESLYGGLLGTLSDGDYTITARATDAFGNTGVSAPVAFVVDKTPPVISIAGAQNGGQYTGPVTPQISATDAHFEALVALLNGAAYTSGTPISASGTYHLSVSAVDRAGNNATQTLDFTISTGGSASPVITVTGVTNGGQYTADVVPVISVTDADNDSPTYTATLNGNAFTSGTPISANGNYVLVVNAQDAANHTATLTVNFALDKSAPTVSVQQPVASSHLRGTMTTSIQASDNVGIAQVQFAIDGGAWITASTAGAGLYTGAMGSLADGAHSIVARATDTFGNSGSSSAVPFVVDNTPPVITITGAVDGGQYTDSVTLSIVATDTNLLSTSSLLDGVAYVSGTAITVPGTHQLVATAADRAGNVTTRTVNFSINNAAPVISVTGVVEGGRYNTDVVPTITVTDTDAPTFTATLNGAAFTSGSTISINGSYTLVIDAQDAANNHSSLTIHFALDKNAPQVVIDQPTANSYLRGMVSAEFTVTDTSAVTNVAYRLDGGAWTTLGAQPAGSASYSVLLAFLAEGTHSVEARATDEFGNVGVSTTRTFVIDNTAPSIAISGATEGGTYPSATLTIVVTDANLLSQSAMLNGVPYVSGTPVTVNGTYQLVVSASDRAGNTAASERNFVIQAAAPTITVTGVTEGGSYTQPVTPIINVTGGTNPTYTATLNGAAFVSGTQVTQKIPYTLVIHASNASGATADLTMHFEIVQPGQTLPMTVTAPLDNSTTTQATTSVVGDTAPNADVSLDVNGTVIAGVANASGHFVFNNVALANGANLLKVSAHDAIGATSPTVTVHVTATLSSAVTLNAAQIESHAVLVWLDSSADCDCRIEGSFGQRVSMTGNCGADHYSPLTALLEAAFAANGSSYLIVHSETNFLDALHTGRYDSIVLSSLSGTDGSPEHLNPSASTFTELKNYVAAGHGLTWVMTHYDTAVNSELKKLFGANALSQLDGHTQLVLPDSVVSTYGAWDADIDFSIDIGYSNGGIRVGDIEEGPHPAMSVFQYGSGNTVLMGFDPSSIHDPQGALSTIQGVLGYIQPPPPVQNVTNGIATLRWTAQQMPVGGSNYEMHVRLPAGATLLEAADGGSVVSATEAKWTIPTVTSTNQNFTAVVRLPAASGSAIFTGELDRLVNSQWSIEVQKTLTLNVAAASTAPTIVIGGVTEGGVYDCGVTPVITVTGGTNPTYTATLNGAAFTSGTKLTATIPYTLIIHATNTSGTSDRTVHFEIQPTPTLTLNLTKPFDNSTTRNTTTHIAGYTAASVTVTATVNGSTVLTTTSEADGSFALDDVAIHTGVNTIKVKAHDAAGAISPEVTVHVTSTPTLVASLEPQWVEQHAALAWLPATPGSETCRIEGHYGVQKSQTGVCTEDRYSPLIALMQAQFAEKGWSYLIVRNETAFLAAMRSLRYDDFLLAELNSTLAGSASLGMTAATWSELKGSVASGAGLAFIKTQGETSQNTHLKEVFGSIINTTTPQLTGLTKVVVPDSPATWAGTWTMTAGKGSKLNINGGGERVGDLKPNNPAASSIYTLGNGHTILVAFDPSALDDPEGANSLMHGILFYTAPPMPQHLMEGAVAPLKWTAHNVSSDGTGVEFHVTVPSNVSIIEVGPEAEILNAHEAKYWVRPTENDWEFNLRVVFPNTIAHFPLHGSVSQFIGYGNSPTGYELLAETDFDIETSLSRANAATSTLAAINAMTVTSGQQSSKTAAINAVTAAKNRTQNTQADAAASIANMVTAINSLLAINPDPQEVLYQAGDLLLFYQALWTAKAP